MFTCGPQDRNASAESAEPKTLAYYSDYFSFVGCDSLGVVAFALDNNRGVDGSKYQAEHFVVLFDETTGWIDVSGSGRYANAHNDLMVIPDSRDFVFSGSAKTGFEIISTSYGLSLQIASLTPVIHDIKENSNFQMGATDAQLLWNGRRINGRVIYEYLHIDGFNRLTRSYDNLWDNFQALYLRTDSGEDYYMHIQSGALLGPIVGDSVGFSTINGNAARLELFSVVVTDSTRSSGGFYWPTAWQIECSHDGNRLVLSCRQSDIKEVAYSSDGGFAMGIVRGSLISQSGDTVAVTGFAELLL